MSAASRKAVTDKIVTHADGEIERLTGERDRLRDALRGLSVSIEGKVSADWRAAHGQRLRDTEEWKNARAVIDALDGAK